MPDCPGCGKNLSLFRSFLSGMCKDCESRLQQEDRDRAEAEAAREWNLTQVDEEQERNWRPECCPFCGGSMLVGFVGNSEPGDDSIRNELQWVAGSDPPNYLRSDMVIMRDGELMEEWRRAHLCESCGTLIVVQALRKRAQDPTASAPELDDTSAPTECLACGEPIPAGRSTCAQCGWSYRAND